MSGALWLAGFIALLAEADRIKETVRAEREASRRERAAQVRAQARAAAKGQQT